MPCLGQYAFLFIGLCVLSDGLPLLDWASVSWLWLELDGSANKRLPEEDCEVKGFPGFLRRIGTCCQSSTIE